jgi:hypothetical protein
LLSSACEACAWRSQCGEIRSCTPFGRPARRLQEGLARADTHLLRLSEAFDDAEKLLTAAIELGLEGIVSKRRDQRYVSGKNAGWIKVKTAAWREANRDRWEMFEESR